MNWGWLDRNFDTVLEYTREHIEIALIALFLGVVIAFPVGLIAYRWRFTYGPILALTQILYTVPSLALFVLLINVVGLGQLFIHGFQIDNPIEIWTGIALTLVLAVVIDLLIVGGGRLLTPWTRAVR
jgi:ABC-type proline/glycine betaine transport system permease subunit